MYKKIFLMLFLILNPIQLKPAYLLPGILKHSYNNFFKYNATLRDQTSLPNLIRNCFFQNQEFVNLYGTVPDNYPPASIDLSMLEYKLDKFNEYAVQELGNIAGFPHVQKIFVPSGSEICFMGDIHGSIHSLLRNIFRLYLLEYIDENFKIINPNFYMVFLGDYVDRGKYSTEVLNTLLSLKLANWKNVSLTRGNHETRELCAKFGFFAELDSKYFEDAADIGLKDSLQNKILKFYSNLTFATYINSGKDESWIQCCHGGIDPTFSPIIFLQDKESAYLNLTEALETKTSFDNTEINDICVAKFYQSLDTKCNCGFNWCDFEDFNYPPFGSGYRGYICSIMRATELFKLFGIKAIFRGHQHNLFGLKLGGQIHWKDYIENQTTFNISPYPVFTFSTAAEGAGLPYDCFGILKTADKYEDWILTPYEFELPSNRNGKYVHVTMAAKGQAPLFEWHNEPQTV